MYLNPEGWSAVAPVYYAEDVVRNCPAAAMNKGRGLLVGLAQKSNVI